MSKLTTDYKYYGNDEAICPYCDYVESDSWEIAQDTQEEWVLIECGNCDKKYLFEREAKVTYTTEKADCANDITEHKWRNKVSAPRHYSVGKQYCEVCFTDRKIDEAEWEKIEADHNHPENWRS